MEKNFMAEFENAGIMNNCEMTQEEFRKTLLKIQDVIGQMIFEDGERHRIVEACSFLERTARNRKIERDPTFRKGMNDLQKINKELAISMAGKNGERRVSDALRYISVLNYQFKNVYITDGETETELDNVILTENGIIILEVKNAKYDITISETGRLLYANEECYHDVSICDKMQKKRDLLKAELEKALADKNLDIPLQIDSFIVFSTPKGEYIKVTDLCKKEKYCFRGKLPFLISEYTSDKKYTDEELQELKVILRTMKTRKRAFASKVDICEALTNIARAMDKCLNVTEEIVAEEKCIKEETIKSQAKTSQDRLVSIQDYKQTKYGRVFADIGQIVASFAVVSLGILAAGRSLRKIDFLQRVS